jgi:hypothetical protein
MGLIPEGEGDHVNITMSLGSMPLGFAVISVTTIERELLQGDLEEFVGEIVSLEADLSDIGSTVGSWQLISAGALLIGAIIGYMVMRYHGSR